MYPIATVKPFIMLNDGQCVVQTYTIAQAYSVMDDQLKVQTTLVVFKDGKKMNVKESPAQIIGMIYGR